MTSSITRVFTLFPPKTSFENLQGRLDQYLVNAGNAKGEIKDILDQVFLEKIAEVSPDCQSPLIQQLSDNITAAEQKYQQIRNTLNTTQTALKSSIEGLQNVLERTQASYQYLGQFEEYETNFNEIYGELKEVLHGARLDTKTVKNSPAFLGPLDDDLKKFKKTLQSIVESILTMPDEDYKKNVLNCKKLSKAITSFKTSTAPLRAYLKHSSKQKSSHRANDQDNALMDFECKLQDLISWAEDFHRSQRAITRFDSRLAEGAVAKAIDEDSDYSIDDLRKAFEDYQQSLQQFYNNLDSFKPDENELSDIEDRIELQRDTLVRVLEGVIAAIETQIDKATPERYDDPRDDFTASVLNNKVEQFYKFRTLLIDINDQYETLVKKLLFRRRLENALSIADQEIKDARKKLVKKLREIKPNSKLKKADKALPTKLDADSAKTDLPPDLKQKIDTVILLLRKKLLENPELDTHLKTLYRKQKEQQDTLHALTGKPEDRYIDPYIELTRTNRQIRFLEAEIKEKQRKLAEAFLPTVGRYQPPPNTEVAYALYADDTSTLRTFGVEITPRTPLDSALVELYRALAPQKIPPGKFKGFLSLSDRKFSAYETGFFDAVLDKTIESYVCPKSIYDEVAREETASATPTPPLSVPLPNPSCAAFNLEQLPPLQGNTDPLNEEMKSVYALMAIRLAFHFRQGNGRKKLKLPYGWPVVCIIASKEGQILSWGINTKGDNLVDLTKHAEINAISAYLDLHKGATLLPEGALIFTSLKPCQMCAGAIAVTTAPFFKNLDVRFGQLDPTQLTTYLDTHEHQLSHDFVTRMDSAYKAIKKKYPTVCAADSLGHSGMDNLFEGPEGIKETLNAALNGAPPESLPYIRHLKDFYKICTGTELGA